MQALQNHDLLSSDTHAMDQLQDFLRQRRAAHEPVAELHTFEQEFHRLFVAAEREALSHELARFDLDVPAVEVEGERYHRVLRCATTSTSAVGPVRVERSLYRCARRASGGVPTGTARRDHRGRLDPVGGTAGHLGGGALDAQRGRGTLCPVGEHDTVQKHARSVTQSAACLLGGPSSAL